MPTTNVLFIEFEYLVSSDREPWEKLPQKGLVNPTHIVTFSPANLKQTHFRMGLANSGTFDISSAEMSRLQKLLPTLHYYPPEVEHAVAQG